jgi:trigger factor
MSTKSPEARTRLGGFFFYCIYQQLVYTHTVMTQEELKTITLLKLPHSEVKLEGEVPYSYLAKYRAHAVEHVGSHLELKGFRKGHIPEAVLIQQVGEMALINDMAEHALEDAYRDMVTHFKLDVIGHPKVSITKLAKDNPLGFSITVAVMPDVTLPDYKKIATKINAERESKEVTEEEITKQIEEILRQKVAYERLQSKAAKKAGAEKQKEAMHGETVLPTPETVEEKSAEEDDSAEIKLPELTDEYVKTLGQPGQFESVADFRSKIKEHLTIQKAQDVDARHRAKITDSIIEETTVDLPQIMIDAEMNQMFAQMEEDLARAQLKMDDYLGHIKKTREDLMKEWEPNAGKRAKLQLVLNQIAKEESITPDPSLVDHEVSGLLERYKEADEARVRVYVTSVMTNDAVMKMLESI